MNLTAGTTLQNGKYLLGNVLGQGGGCVTLQATQAYLNQTVVLKTLRSNLPADGNTSTLQQQFLEESRRFAQCQHPGLVRVVDLFVEAGLPFAAMDYVAGQSLANLVQARGALPEAQAIQYIRQVGSALSVVHRQGLVHQNVNPQNLIRPQAADFVVLVDFGIMRQTVLNSAESSADEDCYAAIEQFQPQEKLSPATDIYALAGTLYFLLTGKKPIAASLRHQTSLPSPCKFQPQLSSAVEAAILSGLEMNIQSRPQTIAAWFALLPHNEALPPVYEFSNQQGQVSPPVPPTVQLPQKAAVTNGTKAVSSPPQPPSTQTTRVASPPPPTVSHTPSLVPKSRFPKAIVATAIIAGGLGLGLGLVLRLGAASGIGPRIFNTQQSFPPVNNWPGSAEPTAAPLAPLPPPPAVRRDPGAPSPARSAAPPPVGASPSPTPQPSPVLTPESFPSPNPEVSATPSPTTAPLPQESVTPQLAPSPEPVTSPNPETSPVAKPKEGAL
ncbi:protein kinase [Kovacikia minuta CCNUW1]|uniref:serine/threonine protein kinase n=1 Tax=Kovacikia minuta TaxID=2931930 RepID=UPI001CCB03D9|nr:serine/threonine-protein kinase [Kovacikia minuta]UBF28358.1 protein kinase [Kovacikia minuta CCNUW1]